MFTATYNGEVLHDPRDERQTALNQSATLTLTEAGSYTFTLPPTHPLCGKLQVMARAREVVLYEDDEEIFRGRVRAVTNVDIYGYWTYECEGERAYLNDICLPIYQTGENDVPTSADALFNWYVQRYNDKVPHEDRFEIGINEGWRLRAGDDLDRSSEQNPTVWAEIKEKLIDALGGYIRVRHEGGTRYIDWLSDGTRECTQRIEFGENLTDYAYTEDGTELYTRIVPYGQKEVTTTDEEGNESTETVRFDITELPDQGLAEGYEKIGDAVVSVDMEAKYGVIETYAEYRDVTQATTLMMDAYQDLVNSRVATSVKVSAIDLHRIDPDVERIALGDFVRVTSTPHNFDAYMLCTEINVNPSDATSTYTLGTSYDTLTGDQSAKLAQLNVKLSEQTATAEGASEEAKQAARAAQEALTKLADLKGTYVHIRYSETSTGANMTETPTALTEYIGIVSTSSPTAPTDADMYAWSLIRGKDGVQGKTGADGKASYLHIKWSDDGEGFTADGGEVVGDWIGTYVDSTEADSTSFNDYEWKKIKGEQGDKGAKGDQGAQGEQGETGNGIESITEHYQVSTSNSTAPTTWQSAMPTLTVTNKYLWNYATIKYTDGTSKDTTKCVIGVYGNTGAKGDTGSAGADGKMLYGTCSTAAGTAAKVATVSGFSLYAGATVSIKFTYANTAGSPTLNVSGTGAKQILTNGSNSAYWAGGNSSVMFCYDGSAWQVCSQPVYAASATVGNPSSKNVYIDSNGMSIRNGTSTTLASFDASTVKLGANSTSASIQLCGAKGSILNSNNQIYMCGTNGTVLKSGGIAIAGSNGIGITGSTGSEQIMMTAATYMLAGEYFTNAWLRGSTLKTAITAYPGASTSMTYTGWTQVKLTKTLTEMKRDWNTITNSFATSDFTLSSGSIKCNFDGYVLITGGGYWTGAVAGDPIQFAAGVGTSAGDTSKTFAPFGGNWASAASYGSITGAFTIAQVSNGNFISLICANWNATRGTVPAQAETFVSVVRLR